MGLWYVLVPGWQESFKSSRVQPVMALYQLWHSHVDPYLHVHHPRCLLCMSIDVILAGWQETFRSTARRLAADLKVSCQPAGRRHFQNKYDCFCIKSTLSMGKIQTGLNFCWPVYYWFYENLGFMHFHCSRFLGPLNEFLPFSKFCNLPSLEINVADEI